MLGSVRTSPSFVTHAAELRSGGTAEAAVSTWVLLEQFNEGICDLRPVVVSDAGGGTLHVLHQAV